MSFEISQLMKNTFQLETVNPPNCFHLDSPCTSIAIICKERDKKLFYDKLQIKFININEEIIFSS